MIALILGPNGSGKSAYAEALAMRLAGTQRRYYIATMRPYGEDGRERVARHRTMRQGKGFVTIERGHDIACIKVDYSATVLIEDVSNLLANIMFSTARQDFVRAVVEDVRALLRRCAHGVIVSIEGLVHEEAFDESTCAYIDALSRVNQELFTVSDAVVRMDGGTANWVKGEAYAFH